MTAGIRRLGIVGGTLTNYAEWQGVVGLKLSEPYWICSGTLIHPKVVLTTGHCVYNPDKLIDVPSYRTKLSVLGGAHMEIAYPEVEDVVLHPDWTGEIDDSWTVDLALVKLIAPVDTVEAYEPRSSDVAVGEVGWIVGYGLAESGDPLSSKEHRKGRTEVIAISDDGTIELGGEAGTCLGDSGGPFFTREREDGPWLVTGVNSFGGSEECDPEGGNWAVNLAPHRDWIAKTVDRLLGVEPDSGPDTETDSDSDSGTETVPMDEGETDEDTTDHLNDSDSSDAMDAAPGDPADSGVDLDDPAECECEAAGRRAGMGLLAQMASLVFKATRLSSMSNW